MSDINLTDLAIGITRVSVPFVISGKAKNVTLIAKEISIEDAGFFLERFERYTEIEQGENVLEFLNELRDDLYLHFKDLSEVGKQEWDTVSDEGLYEVLGKVLEPLKKKTKKAMEIVRGSEGL